MCVCVSVCILTAYTTRNHCVVDGVKTRFSAQVEDLGSLENQDEFVNLDLHMYVVCHATGVYFLKQDN